MKYKSKDQKDFERQVAIYDERIAKAQEILRKALECADSQMFVACNSVSYEPVCITPTGYMVTSFTGDIKLHVSREDAGKTAAKAHAKFGSSIFLSMTLGSALNYHISWLKRRKQVSIDLRTKMVAALRNNAKKSLVGDKSNWWDKV